MTSNPCSVLLPAPGFGGPPFSRALVIPRAVGKWVRAVTRNRRSSIGNMSMIRLAEPVSPVSLCRHVSWSAPD